MDDRSDIRQGIFIRSNPPLPTLKSIEEDNYGYQWWRIAINSGEKQYDAIWANGLGSQFIPIFPGLDMVLVTTGYNYQGERSWEIFDGLRKHLYLVEE